MIDFRLRRMFEAEHRPLLVLHLVLALTLLPIPALLTPWAYILKFLLPPLSSSMFFGFVVGFWLFAFSFLPIPAFLAWSWPSLAHVGVPKRSIVLLCLLTLYNPYRIYVYRRLAYLDVYEHVATLEQEYIALWEFKNFDTPVLLALVFWAFRRRRTMQAVEKTWFHWLLFVCTLWTVCDFYDDLYKIVVIISLLPFILFRFGIPPWPVTG